MKILITGANGFLGRACASALRERGHTVVTTDQHGPCDFTGDLADKAFTRSLPSVDAVLHAAAVQYVTANLPLLGRKAWFERNNVEATRQLCDRYRQEPTTYFLYVGTSMMYRQGSLGLLSARDGFSANGVYSDSKLRAFAWVQSLPNPNSTIIPCIIGGVGREGLFRQFVSMLRAFGWAAFPGTGQHQTHMVHVKDVADLVTLAIEKRAPGLFNAASPEPLTLNQWVEQTAHALNITSPRTLHVPLAPIRLLSRLTGYRLLAQEQLAMLKAPHILDISDSLALGWQPRYSNAKIIAEIATYIASAPR
jgi:nucleoside-diphosphate-sugar epimerase